MKTIKLILACIILLGTLHAGIPQTIGYYAQDSLKPGDSTWVITLNQGYDYNYLKIKGTATTDSLKIYHSYSGNNWTICPVRNTKTWDTIDTLCTNGAVGTYTEYFINIPRPARIMIRYVNAIYNALRRIDFEYIASKIK